MSKTNLVHRAMYDEVIEQREELRSRVKELEKALEGVPAELIKAIHYREALDYYANSNLWDGGLKARVALNR